MTHQFDPEVAARLGINQAIVLYNLAYLQRNREAQGGDKYHIDGRWWVHHTYESLLKIHPYFSLDQLRRIMKSLLDGDAVFRCHPDRFNRDSYWSVAPEFIQSAKSPNRKGEIAGSESAKSPVVQHENNIRHIRGRFTPPTVQELIDYIEEKNYYYIDPKDFIDFYESKNWMVGKNKMSKWKAAASRWHRAEKKRQEAGRRGRI